MSEHQYEPRRTALLLVDPYNDFLSEGGKIWPMVKGVAEEVGLFDHLRTVVAGARSAGIKIFFVPHRRWEPGDYEGWDHVNPSQRQVQQLQPFAKDTWGGEWHPDFTPQHGDIIIKEHWPRAASPTRTWTSNSSSTASPTLSRLGCSPTPASSRPGASPWSSATM
jgi:nicotinamidase-related amidase